MRSHLVLIKIARDEEAGVWYVEHSDVPGLRAEAETADALMGRLPDLLTDLLEENGAELGLASAGEIVVEVIASHAMKLQVPEAA